MERVDFYIVENPGPEGPQRVACRLAEKAWRTGHRVFIHTASGAEARHLDDLLWTFRQDSFVPHGLQSDRDATQLPILIGDGAEPREDCDVLINLTDGVPSFCERFARVAELVGGDDESRLNGRERYRSYRDRGCTLESHKLS